MTLARGVGSDFTMGELGTYIFPLNSGKIGLAWRMGTVTTKSFALAFQILAVADTFLVACAMALIVGV